MRADWAPARFTLPAFKLLGLIVAPFAAPNAGDREVMLGRHPQQGRIESESLSIYTAILSAAVILHSVRDSSRWVTAAAVLLLPFIIWTFWVSSWVVTAALMYLPRKVFRISEQLVQTVMAFCLVTAGAWWLASRQTPLRFIGWIWLLFVAINLIAIPVLLLARGHVLRLDSELRGEPSAV